MSKRKFSWKWLLIGLAAAGLVVIAGCGLQERSITGESVGDVQVGYVSSVTLTNSVEASGTLQAAQSAALTWQTSGTVAEVYVAPGDFVEAGDVLAALDTTSAPASVITAQASLVAAEERLENLLSPDAQTVALAEVQLAGAFEAWDAARQSLRKALDAVRSSGDDDLYDEYLEAEEALEEALNALPLPAAGVHTQACYRASWMVLQGEYDALQVQLENLAEELDGDTQDLLDELVEAQGEYERLAEEFSASLEGETAAYEDALAVSTANAGYRQATANLMAAILTRYEVQVQPDPDAVLSAQAEIDAIRSTLDNLQVTAPFAGEVLEVYSAAGDVVSPGTPALLLVDRSSLKVRAEVDESEIAAILPGQNVELELEALPGLVLQGQVDYANPQGFEAAGMVSYTVWILVENPDQAMPLGGNASLTIWTGAPQTALAAPLPAIQYDNRGEFVMRVSPDGSLQRVDVVSGNFVGDMIAVQGALQPGDIVQLLQAEGATFGAMSAFDMGK